MPAIYHLTDFLANGFNNFQFQAFLNSVSVESCQSDIDEAIRDALNNISWHQLHDSELYDLLSPLAADNTQTGTVPPETVPTETVPTQNG